MHRRFRVAALGPREFEVDRATCRGDSGGPAIDVMSGEIVGVVSRGDFRGLEKARLDEETGFWERI